MRGVAVITLIIAFCAPAGVADAHPGGTDASGCHVNRKTGERHCHGAKAGSAATGGSRRPAPSTAGQRRGLSGGSPYYARCREAWDAGVAPIRRGEPGYAPHLDRDNDGVACEVMP